MTKHPGSGFLLLLFVFVQHIVYGQSEMSADTSARLKPLGKNVCTPSDETAPVRYADKLYFTSETLHEPTGKKLTRTFASLREEPPFLLPENPRAHSRHMSDMVFNLQADRMYFTLFRKNRLGEPEDREIWYRDRDYDGSWNSQVRPPEPVNVYGFEAMQPALGFDRATGNEVLFFVSNRPDGKGGLDLWMSEIQKGKGDDEDTFAPPVNLPFNSEADDVCPFFDTRTQSFYFSSKKDGGLGGFDIYRVEKNYEGEWGKAEHLKAPLNSEQDEQCFSIHHSSGKAYFSSNRFNENCALADCQNFDIYQAEMTVEVELDIVYFSNDLPLLGCNVELLDPQSGEILQTHLKVPEGRVSFDIPPGKAFQVIVSKMGYHPQFLDVLAERQSVFSKIGRTVRLKPMNAAGK